MDKPNAVEPHKTSQAPDEEAEWRGGEQQRREAEERSGERGWGAGMSEKDDDGRERQQGQGGRKS